MTIAASVGYLQYPQLRKHFVVIGQEHLKYLHSELHCISDKWYSLGVQLEVPIGILRCIRRENPTMSECLLEMLTTWLNCTNPSPTLEALAEALESPPVGERTLHC